MGRTPWSNRLTVEQCVCLSVTDMRRVGVFRSIPGSQWILKHRSETFEYQLPYTVVEASGRAMGLQVAVGTGRLYVVEVTTTRPRFGGIRYWLKCPLERNGTRCGRRVGRLYLPPGQIILACRTCADLTYASSRTHDSRKDALRRDMVALADALQNSKRRRLALIVLAELAHET